MNTITGKVVLKESGAGIPDLLVVVYDLDPGTRPEETFPPAPAGVPSVPSTAPDAAPITGDRIGSVLTAADGSFSISYDDTEFRIQTPDEKRPDLYLSVLAPEDADGGGAPSFLYKSSPLRQNAGRMEAYVIRIPTDRLKGAQIPIPGVRQETVDVAVQGFKDFQENRRALTANIAAYQKGFAQQTLDQRKAFRSEFVKSIATDFAKVPSTGVMVPDTGGDIQASNTTTATTALGRANTLINDRGVPVTLYLTPEDRTNLGIDTSAHTTVQKTEAQVRDILFRTDNTDNPLTLLVHDNPIAKFCAEQTVDEKCAEEHTGIITTNNGNGGSGGTGGDPGGNGHAISNTDIPTYLGKLISTVPSPDSVMNPDLSKQRADMSDVESSVDSFALNKGPADVPAFYDFSTLHVAFEHVWRQLLDEDMIVAAQNADEAYQRKYGASILDPLRAFGGLKLAGAFMSPEPKELPPDIAALFDITIDEYVELSPALQTKLATIAADMMNTYKVASLQMQQGIGGLLGGQLYKISYTPSEGEKYRQDLREQADRIIDTVRTDDYYTLHRTLRDLQQRITSAYEFTVFAADKDYHSVNFGLITTFRQEWIPLTYQPGRLVKTMALSPKEERKYSVKVSRLIKHATKEATKNNSSLVNEQSSTARVEADIISKAQTKTNFGLTTEGSYDFGIGSGNANTTFGVDAQNESSQDRKDFREAVLKATQQYNQEHSTEVSTEESTNEEYNESGTVVNPNDELSVTYLFYELQRRYRVSEKLYRVTPVALVAQQVPRPDEINEAWVIANDWVINRYLLDDSFRPALQYLATKSVGEDYAVRELRKNLRQQRNLVESLRIEFSKATAEADSRYATLENEIRKRIAEQQAEDTDGWFSDIKQAFGGGGQDPEAAKARELAAKDAHQYAVEKAEKAGAALRQEINNLHELTTAFNTAMSDHLDSETRVKRLLVHIRINMLYYMQAIWSMEPPDQRFLRLHKVQVPDLQLDPAAPGGGRTYDIDTTPTDDIFASFRAPGTTRHDAYMKGKLQTPFTFKPLVEVADLGTLLGFMGNYMVFPLKQHNALTEFMAAPFVDSAFGAMDPDQLSNVNLSEYSRYVCCLHDKLSAADFLAIKPLLRRWLEQILADPLRNGDEIVVPTSSLFIEALPGTHPLLEDFKLKHRELDVFKVQAEVRKLELENVRLAARLLNNEREDPDVDKTVVVEGSGVGTGVVVNN